MDVELDKLPDKLSEIIEGYSDDVQEEAMAKLEKAADDVLAYVSEHCPRSGYGTNHLADSFVKTEVGSGLEKTIYISSKTKGRLVHLIELGFRHRSGKHVAAQPFMRPAYDAFAPEMIEDIKRIIRGENV
ncbi:MAG: HK97 gp10 family phage protein [Candidatus Cloacimonetes bacterium]|jgi:5,10-methylenetetrahydrofolate reductase|nr:HK97 gp10 family phage protein [Candidatus Cloacimonadota bacterium]